MITCEQFDQLLDDYLDARLDAAHRTSMEAHVAACPSCRTLMESLRLVKEEAARLPRSIAPPRTLWPDIAARLPARAPVASLPRPAWVRWAPLAAAAVLLIIVTVSLTLRLVHPAPEVAVRPAPAARPVQGFAAEREYALAAEDLERVLEEGRDQLAPATVEALERSLALIDAAIAEAHAALAADPANADVRALLWGALRQKLDLLERATRLTRS